MLEDTSLPLAMTAEIMGGFHQFGQEQLLEPFSGRYFDALHQVWESRDLPEALAFGERMYPRLIVSHETIERTDGYLGRGDVPAPLRRLLLEGKDGVARALRTRKADGAPV